MNNRIKLKSNSENKVFFTGDLHMSQINDVARSCRGFNSIQEKDQRQIEKCNKVVSNSDYLFSLGDFQFSDPTGDLFLKHVKALNFKQLFMCPGNHTSGFKKYFNDDSGNTIVIDGRLITNISNYAEIIINNTLLILSHYPIAIWNEMAKGVPHLHAHTHGHYQLGRPENKIAKILDCGLDIFPQPIEFHEIMKIMDTKAIQVLDHHV